MVLVLVDTSVWIDFFDGRLSQETAWLAKAFYRLRIGIPDLSLAELLQGATDLEAEDLEGALRAVTVLEVGGARIARLAAANYRNLRRRGLTVRSTIDCLIATFAIENDLPLLHSDRDFKPFERHLDLRSALELTV